jgi:DNA replication and repair protein RecF
MRWSGGVLVKTVSLRDFRSYPALELDLEPGLVLVTGENGVGKTNLLEALHVGSQGFSPRTRADAQIVRFGAERARVRVVGTEEDSAVESEVTLRAREPKELRLNGAPLAGPDELRTRLSALVFVPDRLAVVKGGPLVRRAYFDRMLGRLFPAQAAAPTEYGRALAQRNEGLRRVRAGTSTREAVRPWTERVAELGTELERARAALIGLAAPRFAERAAALGLADAALAYEEEALTVEALEERFERDVARGATGLGPHLRDVGISAGPRELRSFGSQGEQRVAVLALVLAEGDLMHERRGAGALLLLDDVLSELDRGRRTALLESLPQDGQTIVTATTPDALPVGSRAPDLVVEVTPGTARRV